MTITLSQLIARTESGNVAHALRFEPAWRYTTARDIATCIASHKPAYMNESTARAILAMSWGKHQIMASNLYSIGYKGTMAQFLNDTTLQEAWFAEFLKSRRIDFDLHEIIGDEDLRMLFARKYNGDAKVYSARLMQIYSAMQKEL